MVIPFQSNVRYLGMHLDSQLMWCHHIDIKIKEFNIWIKNITRLIDRNNVLSLNNKRLIYTAVVRGRSERNGVQLWDCANIQILIAQNNFLRIMPYVPWNRTNVTTQRLIHTNLTSHGNILASKLEDYPNNVTEQLLDTSWRE